MNRPKLNNPTIVSFEQLCHQTRNPSTPSRSRLLFVCDQCYRGHRLKLPQNPTHAACNQRLALRDAELPINSHPSPIITAGAA